MILVVLYESFLTPLIRMLSIPCGVIGAFAALALTGKAINIISFIGLIMLDGLISKNGTLLIDYTNTLVKRGTPLREALVEAGITRLRPILMTSVTMIVGMLPLALSTRRLQRDPLRHGRGAHRRPGHLHHPHADSPARWSTR